MSSNIVVEYIWPSPGDTHTNIRSKCRTLPQDQLSKLPAWNFDGSSTGQAQEGQDTEIIIQPVYTIKDPMGEGYGLKKYITLCDCYYPDGRPTTDNTRFIANQIFTRYSDKKYWFGLEQEFFIFENNEMLDPRFMKRGQYYCGNGLGKMFARDLLFDHYSQCLASNLQISGINAEVAPGQYEYQIGPVEGITASDQLIVSRFLLNRVAETKDLEVDYSPKPLLTRFNHSEENGSGCHCNFSNVLTRSKGGMQYVNTILEKLSLHHREIINIYGKDNHLRLTGKHETSSMETFTYGVGTRHTSVRIPNACAKSGEGYIEDRRPASNMDPYMVTSSIVQWIES